MIELYKVIYEARCVQMTYNYVRGESVPKSKSFTFDQSFKDVKVFQKGDSFENNGVEYLIGAIQKVELKDGRVHVKVKCKEKWYRD